MLGNKIRRRSSIGGSSEFLVFPVSAWYPSTDVKGGSGPYQENVEIIVGVLGSYDEAPVFVRCAADLDVFSTVSAFE